MNNSEIYIITFSFLLLPVFAVFPCIQTMVCGYQCFGIVTMRTDADTRSVVVQSLRTSSTHKPTSLAFSMLSCIIPRLCPIFCWDYNEEEDNWINISICCCLLNNIRLRNKWNKQPLDRPIKNVAFPSDLFRVHFRPMDRHTTRHLRYKKNVETLG